MLWFKAWHIIAMVSWFAGLFYLPRLFVYHATTTDQISLDRFQTMERRLYRGIMTPAMVVTVALGISLILFNSSYYLSAGWFHLKLSLVLILIGFHFYCGYLRKQFAQQKNTHSEKFYRWLNEFPTLILISVVLLTVLKP